MDQHLPIGSPLLYLGFFIIVSIMIAIDMIALKTTGNHKVSLKEALTWSNLWVSVALLFNLGLWFYVSNEFGAELAKEKALEFLIGYTLEKALAVDNIFVFLMIFASLKIPQELQRRVLLYGVFGALIMRAIMIFIGAALVKEFDWILYLFGAFLIFTGIKMMMPEKESDHDITHHPLLKYVKKIMPISPNFDGEKFFTRQNGVLMMTPLFLAVIMVEVSDIIFATDSIPAIFAITTDPFIVLTSNIFAILGLRAMYFLLADIADRFYLLKYGLAIILTFIGIKMLIIDFYHVPIVFALLFVLVILIASVGLSYLFPKKSDHESIDHE